MRIAIPSLLALLACTDANDVVDTAAPDCASAPVVTWANFGAGFVLASCQGCHASTVPDRYGAPEDVIFDTVDDVWARAPLVLGVAASDNPTMPPLGGVNELDRQKLRIWLTCADEGT